MPLTARLIRSISPGRMASFSVLEAVAAGAYASDSLREATRALTPRDASLAGQIVFGCLRRQNQLDFLLESYSGRAAGSLDLAVRIALRTALFQILFLERVPLHAAVNDSVEFVKHRKRSAAGLTNAVLRKVRPVSGQSGKIEPAWPDPERAVSCPGWLLERWSQQYGPSQALVIAQAALQEPPPYIRVPQGTTPPGALQTEPTDVPGAYRLLSHLPAGLRLHDISSQAIVPHLELAPGLSYLDLCAAPGNKTLQSLETSLGVAIACDISERRIHEVPAVCPRVVLDATQPLPFDVLFDRILIDAPCSGTGTLARNPEIKWRVNESDFKRFGAKQLAILSQAVKQLKPGGRLVYATCSLEHEENRDVVTAALTNCESLTLMSETVRLPGRDEGDGFYTAALRFN